MLFLLLGYVIIIIVQSKAATIVPFSMKSVFLNASKMIILSTVTLQKGSYSLSKYPSLINHNILVISGYYLVITPTVAGLCSCQILYRLVPYSPVKLCVAKRAIRKAI